MRSTYILIHVLTSYNECLAFSQLRMTFFKITCFERANLKFSLKRKKHVRYLYITYYLLIKVVGISFKYLINYFEFLYFRIVFFISIVHYVIVRYNTLISSITNKPKLNIILII